MNKLIMAVLLFAFFVQAQTASGFNWELSGGFSYTASKIKGDIHSTFLIAPEAYYYINSTFAVGPIVNISIIKEKYWQATFLAGSLAKFVFSLNDKIGLESGIGIGYLRMPVITDTYPDLRTRKFNGLDIPIILGLKIKLAQNILFNIRPTFEFGRLPDLQDNYYLYSILFGLSCLI